MVPFLDLAQQYRSLKPEIDAAVSAVLSSGQFILGDAVASFERDFAAANGVAHAVGVNSGTSALHLALLAAGVKADDEVVTTPFTFVATVAAIRYVGAKPVFVDVDPATGNLDPSLLARAITHRTKAVVPVHLHGHPADMDEILAVAAAHDVAVIEDAAQAHAARYRGRPAGSMGALGCFSFYPGKNLGAYGEAGMVVTNDPEKARVLRMLRDWGQERKYHHVMKGFNYRMEALQGAVLRVKLIHLENWTERRATHAARYSARLAGSSVELPQAANGVRPAWHIYAVRSGRRDALQAHLLDRGVQTGIHYPVPVHLVEAHADLGYRTGDFPVAESWARRVLSLPMFPELTDEQIDEVITAVKTFDGAA